MASNPLLIQELVDEFLSHVSETTDLWACALVCRPWSRAAQRALFRVVKVNRYQRLWTRLETTLRASPHLVPLIHTLILRRSGAIRDQMVESICNIPFTRLEHLCIHSVSTMSLESVVAFQRLLSLPTIRRAVVECYFSEPVLFNSIWVKCSPNIRHLHLRCQQKFSDKALHPVQRHPSTPIILESLRLDHVNNVGDWLNHDLCPFDFSQLTVLSINIHTSAVRWSRMASALGNIKALKFVHSLHDPHEPMVDLSLFPNLLFLSINISDLTRTLETFSTITSSSRIRRIVIHLESTVAIDQLDSKIAGLPMQHLPIVNLEMNPDQYVGYVPLFPQLGAKGLLQRTGPGWFERCMDHTESFG
ncbi:hypothetical protein MVEN_01248000 [Mycena venus]|uniref:F-box domain-containing protein n=1 Tax=Mycena venus TaxID=2733690 RepID=A0A8H7CYH1_9AGAR|nr:hypothetical protein MVEN_01248000 [Mycena venus]